MYETQERAKRITDIHVLWGQSTVIEELIQAGKIDEEYLYPFNGDEVLEWWLVTPWLAERLKEQGEIIIDELGCRWWGRLTSGQPRRILERHHSGRVSGLGVHRRGGGHLL